MIKADTFKINMYRKINMCRKVNMRRPFTRMGLAVFFINSLFALPLLALPHAALAFDDKVAPLEPIWLFVGGGGNDMSEIDYRERPKLVVPKDMALPEPLKVKHAENWPNDPDVARKRAARAADRAPQQYEMNKNPMLSQKEMQAGRAKNADDSANLCDAANGGSQDCSALTPIQKLTHVFSSDDPEPTASVNEPKRKFLTEPPPGYRKATRAVAATSDITPVDKPDSADPKAYMSQQNARK